jgi:hypothetical protein
MPTLSLNQRGELCLTLRGALEDPILTTFRHWPHWRRVEIERDPRDRHLCRAVTLITDRTYEPTVRAILKRDFGITFAAVLQTSSPPSPTTPPAQQNRRRG